MSAISKKATSVESPSRRGAVRKARPQPVASRRTTITLSPQAQEIVERFKSASGTSTSAAIDRIIQRSEPKPSRLKNLTGLLVLDVPYRRLNVTLEDVKRAEDEMDRESVERFLAAKKSTSKSNRARLPK